MISLCRRQAGDVQTGSIKFIIPDGVAHSSVYKRFDSDKNATIEAGKDGVLILQIMAQRAHFQSLKSNIMLRMGISV